MYIRKTHKNGVWCWCAVFPYSDKLRTAWYNVPRKLKEARPMERGERRPTRATRPAQRPAQRPTQQSAQRPTQKPSQRPSQTRPSQSSKPAQPSRPAKVPQKKKSKAPWIIGAIVLTLTTLIIILIVSRSGKSVPLNEKILGKWKAENGAMFEFFDTGVVGQYIPSQPELGIGSIITTEDWELRGDTLIIGDVPAKCSVEDDIFRWGKAEYFRLE